LFDPDQYVKGRFQDPSVQLKYDYERVQKDLSEKFKKRLAYHYIHDEKQARLLTTWLVCRSHSSVLISFILKLRKIWSRVINIIQMKEN
jgi:hypothetical protein